MILDNNPVLRSPRLLNKARFKRRTLHVPNLIIRFGTCKVRRLNQLSSTDLYLGRPAVLFDCASRIERLKFALDSDVKLLHVPNLMHTLRINYINDIYPRILGVPVTWHAQRHFILNKMVGKEECACSSCLETTKYTCLRCCEYFCMRCSVFENDETVVGWKVGSSVAYCEPCFREKMEREMSDDKSGARRSKCLYFSKAGKWQEKPRPKESI